MPSPYLLFYKVSCGLGPWTREAKISSSHQPRKCATQPPGGDPALEGKEIDLVLFHSQLLGLWRLSSSILKHIGAIFIPTLISYLCLSRSSNLLYEDLLNS
jgi:hypothetical protein